MQCLLLGHCTCLHPLPSPHLRLVLLIKANRRLKAICCPLLSKPRLHVDMGICSRKSFFSEQSPLSMQKMTLDGITQLWRGSLGAISSYDRWGRQIIRSLTRQLSIEGVLGMLVCSSRLNAVVREYKEIPPSVFCSHRHKRFRTEADHKAHKEKKKKKTRRFKEGDLVILLLLGLVWTETTQIFCLPAELYHILPWNKYLYLDMQYV